MNGFVENIEDLTEGNSDFRRVLYTGRHLQPFQMSLKPGEDIGVEIHDTHDQFFRIETGEGEILIDGNRTAIRASDVIIVPAGARHNLGKGALQLYTLYALPNHIDHLIEATRAVAVTTVEKFEGVTTD